MRLFASLVVVSALAVCPAKAQHGAHSHGTATMTVGVEGNDMLITLVASGHDLVGFEHAPSSDADRSAVARVKAVLMDAPTILGVPEAADCVVRTAKVTSSLLAEADDHSGHDDEDGHGDGHNDETGEAHGDFQAEYHLVCADPAALTALDLSYFKAFPRAQSIEVLAFTDRGQFKARLTADAPRLTLAGD